MNPSEVYEMTIERVLREGAYVEGRNGLTKQATGYKIDLDPEYGFPIVQSRKMFFKSALGEFCSFMHAAQYEGIFAENGCNFWKPNLLHDSWQQRLDRNPDIPRDWLGHIYGYHWRMFDGHIDQWGIARRALYSDVNTRRAVITSLNPADTDACLPPCHLLYQFLIQKGALELHVTMRSLDVVVGLPYDMILFGLMQRTMMEELPGQLKPGRIVINVGSAHIYDQHMPHLDFILANHGTHIPCAVTIKESQNYSPGNYNLIGYPDDLHHVPFEMIA